jgi:hypothetical protein
MINLDANAWRANNQEATASWISTQQHAVHSMVKLLPPEPTWFKLNLGVTSLKRLVESSYMPANWLLTNGCEAKMVRCCYTPLLPVDLWSCILHDK